MTLEAIARPNFNYQIEPLVNEGRIRKSDLLSSTPLFDSKGALVLNIGSNFDYQCSLVNEGPVSKGEVFAAKGEIKFKRPLVEKTRSIDVVGFNAKEEVETAIKNFNNLLIEGKTRKEAGEKSFDEIEENIRSWDEEFVKGQSVFSANYKLGYYEGKKRILDRTGQPVTKKINSTERQGKALEGWINAEEFLVNAPDNSLVIITSPKGRSGQIIDGEEFSYVDSYFQFAAKVNGQVEFFTVRTFAGVETCRNITEALIAGFSTSTISPQKGETQYDEVSNIVGSPIKLSSISNPELNNGLDYFLAHFLPYVESLESNIFGKGKSADIVFSEFSERQKRLKLDVKKQPLIDELNKFYLSVLHQLNDSEVQAMLEDKINEILIKFTLLERGEIPDYRAVLTYDQTQKALDHMQEMHGCSGSGKKGNKVSLIKGAGGFREVVESETFEKGECRDCGEGKAGDKVDVSCGLCKSCIAKYQQREELGLEV